MFLLLLSLLILAVSLHNKTHLQPLLIPAVGVAGVWGGGGGSLRLRRCCSGASGGVGDGCCGGGGSGGKGSGAGRRADHDELCGTARCRKKQVTTISHLISVTLFAITVISVM